MTMPLCVPANQDFYLGNPPNMIKMIQPDSYYSITLDPKIVLHELINGGNATQRTSSKLRRRYGLNYGARSIEDADQIVSIYYGMLGPGPYYFIDPLWRNVLPSHISGCGRRMLNSVGFVPTVGAIAYSSTIIPPGTAGGVPPGVQVWTGAGNGSALYLNAAAAGVLESSAPPCQTGLLPLSGSLYLKAASGTPSVSLQLYFNDATGALISATTLATLALSAAWQRLPGTMLASAIPATAVAYGLKLLCNTAASPALHLSAGSSQYVNPGTQPLPAWVLGLGVPRMLINAPLPSNHAAANRRRTQALDLVEA